MLQLFLDPRQQASDPPGPTALWFSKQSTVPKIEPTRLETLVQSLLSSATPMTAKAYGSSLALGTFCGGGELFRTGATASSAMASASLAGEGLIISTGNVSTQSTPCEYPEYPL